MNFSWRKNCRICNNPDLIKYFDFGDMPLANAFKKPDQKEELFFPQQMLFCPKCANSQLSVVVDPKIMFSNYLYFSSVSKTFQKHCETMANHFTNLFTEKIKCLDIASNDGCLLKEFQKLGNEVIGVEPAKNISNQANSNNIPTICEFWGKSAALKVNRKVGNVDLVTATNVFAHVDEIHDFVKNVYDVLDDNGLFMIEFPYMKNLVEDCEFDTIYHEHLSYFLAKPIKILLEMHRMKIVDLSLQKIHGGSLRVLAAKDTNKTHQVDNSVEKFIHDEESLGLHNIEAYEKLEKSAKKIKEDFISAINEKINKGKKIIGYGASAKGNVFLNYCKIDSDKISFIVDDTKAKQRLIYAGTKIPIVDFSNIEKERPEYIVILPWNFAKEIMDKTKDFKQKGGKYITAIPELKII
ncbi:MAG: class I SAM-dependent methyltransferase [archaeon]